MVFPISIFRFDCLAIRPPPAEAFEAVMGYSLGERFVGFYCQEQNLWIEDGKVSEVGDWRPWTMWYRSLGIDIFRRYCFGYADRCPDHMLVLDRKARVLYAGAIQEAHDALSQQVLYFREKSTEARSRVNLKSNDEDFTDLLVSNMSDIDCESYQLQKKAGMEKLNHWLRRNTV